MIAAAAGCGDTEVATPSTHVAALMARESEPGAAPVDDGEGASDLLLLDREPPEVLTARSRRDCGDDLIPEDRIVCRAALANELTRAAIAADASIDARARASDTASLTHEIEARFGAARRAIVNAPVTEEETLELQDRWRAARLHSEPSPSDEALDAELAATLETLPEDAEERAAFIRRHTHVPGFVVESASSGGAL